MFDVFLKSKFYSKCKYAIRMTKTRIEIVRKKRNAMLKYLKNDIVDLLKSGLDVNAYGRAEGLLVELNLSSWYDLLVQCCQHISSHLATMDKQRECPEDCREAVSSLMFAAARFADLPELRELRTIFTERYGNSLEFFANKEFVEKLKSAPPTKEMKFQLMQDLSVESGVKWNTKDLELKLYKPVMSEQDWPKNHNDREHKLQEINDESAMEKEHEYAKLNYENMKQHTTSTEKREHHHSSYGRKEVHVDEHSFPIRREIDKHEKTLVKDIEMDINGKKGTQNEAKIVKSAGENQETDDEKPFYYRSIQPPYTKSRTCNTKRGSDSSPTCSTRDERGEIENRVQVSLEDCAHDTDEKAKPRPKSVRSRRTTKPQEDTSDERQQLNLNSKLVGVDNRLKTGHKNHNCDVDDQVVDEEENMMDKLLMQYSRKPFQDDQIKKPVRVVQPLKLGEVDAGEVSRPPGRATSLPVEAEHASPLMELRSNSYQRDMLSPNGHVHPKLPDYDDFVTRLATLRGQSKH